MGRKPSSGFNVYNRAVMSLDVVIKHLCASSYQFVPVQIILPPRTASLVTILYSEPRHDVLYTFGAG
jgi:hypothetical protein